MKTRQEILLKAKEYAEYIGSKDGTCMYDYVMGYTKCQEDMADKKYTEEDMKKCWTACRDFNKPAGLDSGINYQDFINSLNKQD